MRALIQRVRQAAVTVDGETIGAIGPGLLILLGIRQGDTSADADYVAGKCVNLRIFEDDAGRFNRSALETAAEILVVSQFTLYGDCRRGRRPSFSRAAEPEVAVPLYERFIDAVRQHGLVTATGQFGARMRVELQNEGPVTVLVESKDG